MFKLYDILKVSDADFLNIDVKKDNLYFIYPYSVANIDHKYSKQFTDTLVDFFSTVLSKLKNNQDKEARKLFSSYLSEPNEAHLGYSTKSSRGKGLKELADGVITSILFERNKLLAVIERIDDLKLYVENCSVDRVSDIAINVCRKVLIDYTKEECDKYGVKCCKMTTKPYWDVKTHEWKTSEEWQYICPATGERVLFVPKAFISKDKYNVYNFCSKIILEDFKDQEINKGSSLIEYGKNQQPYITRKKMINKLRSINIFLNKTYLRKWALDHIEESKCFVEKLK